MTAGQGRMLKVGDAVVIHERNDHDIHGVVIDRAGDIVKITWSDRQTTEHDTRYTTCFEKEEAE